MDKLMEAAKSAPLEEGGGATEQALEKQMKANEEMMKSVRDPGQLYATDVPGDKAD